MRTSWMSAALACGLCGCALDVQHHYGRMRPHLWARDFDRAVAYVQQGEDTFYGPDNAVLYGLDRGMVLHLAGRYTESNAALEQAKQAADALWTESVGRHAAAFATTDNALPYAGEDFERVLTHEVMALNYLALERPDEARVEARQMAGDLALYTGRDEATAPGRWHDDAFARWLTGRLFETEDTPAALMDAWIEYRRALALYEQADARADPTPVPRLLLQQAARTLGRLGPDFADDFAAVVARYGDIDVLDEAPMTGRVVFVHLGGEAPHKVDRFWTARIQGQWLRVAYPEFVPRPARIAAAQVRVDDAADVTFAEPMQDIAAIARRTLADSIERIKAKAIARAMTRLATTTALRVVGEQRDDDVGVALSAAGRAFGLFGALIERADTRSWLTLPATVAVAELVVPAGDHTLEVTFVNARGGVEEVARLDCRVLAGQTRFVSYRTFR